MNSLLKQIPLFSYLNNGELNSLAKVVHKKTFPKNTIIFSEGDEADSLYIILRGKVRALLNNIHGKELVLTIQEPGEYFGELALIDDDPRSATIMTKEETQLLILPGNAFKNLLRDNPDLIFNILKGLTARLRKATDKIEDLAFMNVYGRISRVLIQRAKHVGQKLVIEERLTHQEIANMIGATREIVSRILKKLSDAGYISIKDKHIEIIKTLPLSF
ncbi:MAG: Crp/Fnr family transcriptional regulator [Deltaproteobacteria bacterium]|nr:Crp/Fnr family transcriptional regulator [Deltaproteobacteria bacterium]